MKTIFLKSVLGIFLIVITSCQDNKTPVLVKFNGKALGTFYNISYYDIEGRNFQQSIDSLFDAFNASLSIYDSLSVISKINRSENGDITDIWFEKVYIKALEIYETTSGMFDPTVGPLVNAWGFGFTNAEEMTQDKVDSIITFVGFTKTRLENGMLIKDNPHIILDFNAIAKGYCSDIAAAYLEEKGIRDYLVEIGGEIVARGKKPDGKLWRIGIEKPTENAGDGQEVIQIVVLNNKALATSGNYRRYYEQNGQRYSHAINPKTGFPAMNNLLSVTVIADDCMTADAYATALMVMGFESALNFIEDRNELDAFFIYSDGNNALNTHATEGFQKILE